jgi:hypothetical protein
MKSIITAVFLSSLAAFVGIAGEALAGEDSTHRLHGVGPAWYEIKDGLRKLAAEAPDGPAPTDQTANGSVDESHAAKHPSRSDSADKDARVTAPAHAKSAM